MDDLAEGSLALLELQDNMLVRHPPSSNRSNNSPLHVEMRNYQLYMGERVEGSIVLHSVIASQTKVSFYWQLQTG
jgi:hypothetical protein